MRNISVIVPHFQKQRTLLQVWEELQLQLSPEDEIIIVDDHSPDGVPDITCPCTKTVQPPKQNPHTYRLDTLRNLGLETAKHDACVILDPDCVPNPRYLDNARKLYDPSVLYVGCIDKVQEDESIKLDGRRNSDKSYWADDKDKSGGPVWGGNMMFSKYRTRLVGWFNEEYNGAWGAEDADFGAKCYHSGMRIRFSMGLNVLHQYHPKNTEGYPRNKQKWLEYSKSYRDNLPTFTPYNPAVGVMVITMMRPELINQCLQAIFRNNIPLKVRLINNGEHGGETGKICQQWGHRWAVDYINHERKWPAVIRNESLRWARDNRFKYLVFIDDDAVVVNNGITRLVSSMEKHGDIYAMSGKINRVDKEPWLLGGPLRDKMFYHLTDRKGVHPSDWVGGGFTIHRVNPVLFYDEGYETGFNDYDWSMMAKKAGYNLAVSGDAEMWHAVRVTAKGFERYRNSAEYSAIRYDKERHDRMRKRFMDKWGFYLQGGGVTDK